MWSLQTWNITSNYPALPHCHGWWHFRGTRRLALQRWRSAVESQRQWQAMNDQVGSGGWDDMAGHHEIKDSLTDPLHRKSLNCIYTVLCELEGNPYHWNSLNHLDLSSFLTTAVWSYFVDRTAGCFMKLLSSQERMALISPPNPFVCSSFLIRSASFSGTCLQNIVTHTHIYIYTHHTCSYNTFMI